MAERDEEELALGGFSLRVSPGLPNREKPEIDIPPKLPIGSAEGANAEVLPSAATMPALGSDGALDATAQGLQSAPGDLSQLQTVDEQFYEVGTEIARGGMGRIVRARDRRLGRLVAIKEILVSTSQNERRFEREMRITARLQHPAIIAVYDAGRWPSGGAFFTMKCVDGVPLDRAIARTGELRERLALLPNILTVADALAYAHDRGVIHRDLKPANVLVGDFGETVVIDWGLAKVLHEEDRNVESSQDPDFQRDRKDDNDALTILGHAMGTPAYMPPEQARGETVDERADVYALGAMLYHLLAGAMPYQDTAPTSAQALLKTVRKGPPTSLATLVPNASEDLLAIVTRAMSRNPDERYASAGELAEELRRFESGQLVRAHDYTTTELMKRWVRNRRGAVVVATVMTILLGALAATSYARIVDERDRTQVQKLEVLVHRGQAEGLIDFMLSDLRDKLEPIGKLELLKLVATKTSTYYDERPLDWSRPDEVLGRAKARQNLGDVLHKQGDLAAAIEQYNIAVATAEALAGQQPGDSTSLRNVVPGRHRIAKIQLEQGELDGALGTAQETLVMSQKLTALEPKDRSLQRGLVDSHSLIGTVLQAKGDNDGAVRHFETAVEISKRLVKNDSNDTKSQQGLALGHQRLGRILALQARFDEAMQRYRAALAIVKGLVEIDSGNTVWQRDLANAHSNVAAILDRQDDPEGALGSNRTALAIYGQLAAQDPSNVEWQRNLFVGYAVSGDLLLAANDMVGAVERLRDSQGIMKKLVALDSTNSKRQHDLARISQKVGAALDAQGDQAAAALAFRDSIVVGEKLVALEPGNTTWAVSLSLTYAMFAATFASEDDFHEGSRLFGKAEDIIQHQLEMHPSSISLRLRKVKLLGLISETLESRKDLAGTLEKTLAATAVLEDLIPLKPSNEPWLGQVATYYFKAGTIQNILGDETGAKDSMLRSAKFVDSLSKSSEVSYFSASAHALAGDVDTAFERLDEAIKLGLADKMTVASDENLAVLRSDRRWQATLARVAANE